jgi:hypothetical protein
MDRRLPQPFACLGRYIELCDLAEERGWSVMLETSPRLLLVVDLGDHRFRAWETQPGSARLDELADSMLTRVLA